MPVPASGPSPARYTGATRLLANQQIKVARLKARIDVLQRKRAVHTEARPDLHDCSRLDGAGCEMPHQHRSADSLLTFQEELDATASCETDIACSLKHTRLIGQQALLELKRVWPIPHMALAHRQGP